MPTTVQHDELTAAQADASRAYEQYRDAHERENAWAVHVAEELAIAAAGGMKLPDALTRALTNYQTRRDATVPLHDRWRECSDRAGRLYSAMYHPAGRPLSDPGGTVMPLGQ